LENPAGIDADLAIYVREAGAIAHQAARCGKLTKFISRGNCMARRQRNDLVAPADEERTAADAQRAYPCFDEGRKGCINVAFVADVQNLDCLRDRTRRCLDLRQLIGRTGPIRIEEDAKQRRLRNELVQQSKSLRFQCCGENAYPGDISTGPIDACDEAELNWVGTDRAHDWNRRGCSFGREIAAAGSNDYRNLTADQIASQRLQAIGTTLSPAKFDASVLILDDPGFVQSPAKCFDIACVFGGFFAVQESDNRNRRLLCACDARPRDSRATEKRDEIAASHSITSSAIESTSGGTAMPSARAVCRLMTSSNLVDCNTGRSAGLAPLRMLPV